MDSKFAASRENFDPFWLKFQDEKVEALFHEECNESTKNSLLVIIKLLVLSYVITDVLSVMQSYLEMAVSAWITVCCTSCSLLLLGICYVKIGTNQWRSWYIHAAFCSCAVAVAVIMMEENAELDLVIVSCYFLAFVRFALFFFSMRNWVEFLIFQNIDLFILSCANYHVLKSFAPFLSIVLVSLLGYFFSYKIEMVNRSFWLSKKRFYFVEF